MFNRIGGAMVEAAMVLPVSCLIIFSLAGLIMSYHGQVVIQVNEHIKSAESWDISNKIEEIRRYERFIDWIS